MPGILPRLRNAAKSLKLWLGREDSNLRMADPKSAALPLGDAPSVAERKRGVARAQRPRRRRSADLHRRWPPASPWRRPTSRGLPQHLGRHGRGTTVVEHAKAGRPAAGHAGETAARRGSQGRAGPRRSRASAAGRAFEVIAGAGEPREIRAAPAGLRAPREELRPDTAANTSAVPSGRPGLSSTRSSGWQVRQGLDPLADAAHPGRPACAGRRGRRCPAPGPSRGQDRRVRRQAPQPGKAAQGGGRVGRAAADAGGHREMLVEPDRHARRAARRVGQPHGRTVDDIAVARGQVGGERPAHSIREPVGLASGQLVAELGEHHHAVELVVAVGPAAGQHQVEIELGPRVLDDRPLSRGRRLRIGQAAGQLVLDQRHLVGAPARTSAPAATGISPRGCGRPASRRRPDGR